MSLWQYREAEGRFRNAEWSRDRVLCDNIQAGLASLSQEGEVWCRSLGWSFFWRCCCTDHEWANSAPSWVTTVVTPVERHLYWMILKMLPLAPEGIKIWISKICLTNGVFYPIFDHSAWFLNPKTCFTSVLTQDVEDAPLHLTGHLSWSVCTGAQKRLLCYLKAPSISLLIYYLCYWRADAM